jgi:CRISPR-associated protein Cas1
MLLNDLITACQVAGLDPDLGFFHGIGYGKPSMALDLEEEFRPVIVDSLVLLAVNRPMFGVKDFEVGERAVDKDEAPKEHWQGEKVKDEPPKDHWRLESKKDEEYQVEKDLVLQEGEQKSKKGIYLTEEARKRFIALYEDRVNEQVVHPASGDRLPYRKIFLAQAYGMASAILGETPGYTPFTIR